MHPTEPIAASIEALDWIVGRWAGGRGADRYEEWWAEPAGGAMVGMFRWLHDGAVRFYELLTVESAASPHGPEDEFRYARG